MTEEPNSPPGEASQSSQLRIPPPLTTHLHNHDDGDGSSSDNDDRENDDEALSGETHERTRWRQQINHLIFRKTLYKLGNRGVISILERVYFYIKRLRILINLPADEKRKVKQTLREKLKTSGRLFSPYCGDVLCSPSLGKCTPHIPSPIQDFSFTDKKVKLEKHNLISGPTRGRQTLGNYEIAPASQLTSSQPFFDDFTYHQPTRINLFAHLCELFTSNATIKGFQTQSLEGSKGLLYVARGRKQRCYLTSTTVEPRFRILNSKSAFFTLCLASAHSASLGKSPQ